MNKRFKAAYLTLLTIGMLANTPVIMAEENWFTRHVVYKLIGVVSMGLFVGGQYYDNDNIVHRPAFAATLAGFLGLFYSAYVGIGSVLIYRVKFKIDNDSAKQVENEPKQPIRIDPILDPRAFLEGKDKPKKDKPKSILGLDRLFKALEQSNCLQIIKNIVQEKKKDYIDEQYYIDEVVAKVAELQVMLELILYDAGFVSKLDDAQETTLKSFKENNKSSSDVDIVVKKVFKALDKEKEDFDRDFSLSWVMPNVKEAASLYLKLRKLSLVLKFI